ncbi:MAG: hypothetical protein P0S93_01275 [Candidatus Neptunochlamydia sp.]|nr:hypothetical protein [Candidatus Neptunochlamydia sp.]
MYHLILDSTTFAIAAPLYLLMNKVPLSVIAEILGHKTYQMVKRYAHLSEDHKWQAIASMNQNIFGET